jgi:mono/diheme cytochrome c family protein
MTKVFAAAALLILGLVSSIHLGAQSPDVAATGPTYSHDVAPILYKNCTACHRPGEIGPMSLLSYKDARPWAKSIASRVAAGTMPPWHADPATGEFQNDRRLTDAEKDTIARWVAAGAPEGDPKDLPAPPHYADGWMIGQPDAVLTMREDYPIAASGTIAYQYFEVPTDFAEDRWVQAFEVRPGNRAVVHHVIVSTRAPEPAAPRQETAQPARRPAPVFTFAEGMEIPAGQTGGPALPPDQQKPRGPNDRPAPKRLGPSIGAYVPGNASRVYVPGTAARLVAGSTVIFQMHYTTIGQPTTDRTSIGLIFAKTPPKTELRGTALINGNFQIPAGNLSRRCADDNQSRCDAMGNAAAHPRPGKTVELRRRVSRRSETDHSVRPEVRLRMAD